MCWARIEELCVIAERHTVSLVRHSGAKDLPGSFDVSASGLEHGGELWRACLLAAEDLKAALIPSLSVREAVHIGDTRRPEI